MSITLHRGSRLPLQRTGPVWNLVQPIPHVGKHPSVPLYLAGHHDRGRSSGKVTVLRKYMISPRTMEADDLARVRGWILTFFLCLLHEDSEF